VSCNGHVKIAPMARLLRGPLRHPPSGAPLFSNVPPPWRPPWLRHLGRPQRLVATVDLKQWSNCDYAGLEFPTMLRHETEKSSGGKESVRLKGHWKTPTFI